MSKKRILKSIFALLLAAVLTVPTCLISMADTDRVTVMVSNAETLKETLEEITDTNKQYTLVLTNDIELEKDAAHLVIPEGSTVVIRSDTDSSFKITQVPMSDTCNLLNETDKAMFDIKGSLTLSAITLEVNNNGRGVIIEKGGSLLTYSGAVIMDSMVNGNGGAVLLNGGSLDMKGGEITSNTAALGGGIYISRGTAAISGGTISSNKGSQGSVYADGIYLAEEPETYLTEESVLNISGTPRITNTIFLDQGKYITFPASLGENASIRVCHYGADYGTVIAKYTEEGIAVEEDLSKIRSSGDYGYSFGNDGLSIVVSKIDLADCLIEVPVSEYTYTGTEITPQFNVVTPAGDTITDYTWASEDRITIGAKSAIISGDGVKTGGNATFTFTIKSGSSGTNASSSGTGTGASGGTTAGTAAAATTTAKLITVTGDTTITEALGDENCVINASTSGNGRLSYASSDESVAAVDALGKVTFKNCGQAIITVTSAKTGSSASDSTRIIVNVRPDTISIRSALVTDSGAIKVIWDQEKYADGYQIRYGESADMSDSVIKTVSNWREISTELTDAEQGKTYYIQVRAYAIIEGSTIISGQWSTTRNISTD